MKSNAVKCYGTLGTSKIHLREFFQQQTTRRYRITLRSTPVQYISVCTHFTFHISFHFTFHLLSLPFTIWTVNLLPKGGLHSPSAIHISNRVLLRNFAYICTAERGLCNTLAAYNTLSLSQSSLLRICSLKRSKFGIEYFSRASTPRREANAL